MKCSNVLKTPISRVNKGDIREIGINEWPAIGRLSAKQFLANFHIRTLCSAAGADTDTDSFKSNKRERHF